MSESVNYRSIDSLNSAILKNISKIPRDIDLVVGVPRSGMLPANLIALYLNLPYTDIDSFIDGRIYGAGQQGDYNVKKTIKNILVVDDSICSGYALSKSKSKLSGLNYKFKFLCVYSTPESSNKIDVFLEIVKTPRVFEWNLFHHRFILSKTCMDIDGVLCEDPTAEQNDDGPKYIEFLKNAKPKFIPTVKIKTLISCRLEKYRKLTEEWLKRHGIEYENLILLNLPNGASRRKWGKYGEYKASEYKKADYLLFIESSLNEARIIKEKTGKSVFCVELMRMI